LREEIPELIGRMIGNATEDFAQLALRVDAVELQYSDGMSMTTARSTSAWGQ